MRRIIVRFLGTERMAAYNECKYVYAVRTLQKSLRERNLESTPAKQMKIKGTAPVVPYMETSVKGSFWTGERGRWARMRTGISSRKYGDSPATLREEGAQTSQVFISGESAASEGSW